MLDFQGISVHYGHQDVLSNVTFRVNKGDRIGVVGPNGSGKSTLFKIVLGEMSTDKGACGFCKVVVSPTILRSSATERPGTARDRRSAR